MYFSPKTNQLVIYGSDLKEEYIKKIDFASQKIKQMEMWGQNVIIYTEDGELLLYNIEREEIQKFDYNLSNQEEDAEMLDDN